MGENVYRPLYRKKPATPDMAVKNRERGSVPIFGMICCERPKRYIV